MYKLFSIEKLSLLIIFFITNFVSCIIPTYFGRSSVDETEVKKSDVKITHVLIAGAGSIASRLFLENLSIELTKLLAKNEIQSDYIYVGKIPRRSSLNLSQVVSSKYDGYLVLNPIDTSYTDINKDIGILATPLPGGYVGSGSIYGNQYKEGFYLQFYTSRDSLNKVWQGEINVDFDFANPYRYQKIAKQIINRLIKNGIISKISGKTSFTR